MYAPAAVNVNMFTEKPNRNCIYVYRRNSELLFSNDLCSRKKANYAIL